MRNVLRLLLDALETALSGSGRESSIAATVSMALTVAALGAALWILSAAPLEVPAALLAAGGDAARDAAPPPLWAALHRAPPLPPLPDAGASGAPLWPWLIAAAIVGMAGWRRRRRRRRMRRVGAELPLLAARWRRAAAARRAFLRERARRRAEEARDGAR